MNSEGESNTEEKGVTEQRKGRQLRSKKGQLKKEWSGRGRQGKRGEKKERWQRQTCNRESEQERVSMFETSHWFLLSGTLVSQELDCSMLPLTDNQPTVSTIPWSG